ncbi:tape measure protein [uncultured Endozoicomonas sp.]|uniref:tape measure protein n=1 Tax=uncultured Endozoicomonas sp. TaxID=432652 RepID=UPI00261B7271|nr:tape measure protein [uncultured Endozoicomonas sp.]
MSNLRTSVIIDLAGNLSRRAAQYSRSLQQLSQRGSRSLAALSRAASSASAGIDKMGNRALIGGAGLTFAFKKTFVDTAAEFERFEVILSRLEGSSAKGKQAMDWVSDFAASTPYELNQVTDSFVKLKAYGLDPIQGNLLRTLGDTSAAMGKPLEQAVEAMADAITGENERLKEFGIKARAEGQKIVYEYTANGETMTKVADKSNRAMIQSTLQGIWNDKYGGAMNDLSKTWGGMTSNMSDQWTRFQNMVMSQGAFQELKGEIEGVLGTLNQMNDDGTLNDKAKVISEELVAGLRAAKEVGAGLYQVLSAVGKAASFIAEQTGGYANLAKILATIYLANKALRIGGGLARGIGSVVSRGGSGAAAGAAGAAAGLGGRGMSPAMPLYVTMTNGMGPFPPDEGGRGRNNRRRRRTPSRRVNSRAGRFARLGSAVSQYGSKAMTVASKAALPLAVMGSAYQTYDIATDPTMTTKEKAVAGSEVAGGLAGGAAGAKLGAAIGTALLPGIGTAIGAALGGLGGYAAGQWAGGSAAEAVTGPMQGELKISIDSEGRPRVRQLTANNNLALDVDTGMSMGVIE